MYWFCENCFDIFPFANVLNEVLFRLMSQDININSNRSLLAKCKELTFETRNYSEYSTCDFEDDVDPDNNFYNTVNTKCDYYTEDEFTYRARAHTGLSIIHINSRSLKANVNNIRDLLSNISFKFDVIAISESWLNDKDVLDDIQLDGFDLYTRNRNTRGGGVCFYVSKALQVNVIEQLSIIKDNLMETITIELKFEQLKSIIITCIYRTPGTNLIQFNNTLNIKQFFFYICGDLNVNLLNMEKHQGTKEFVNLMYSFRLYPLLTKPTRVTQDSATIIDNIFTNYLGKSFNGIIINDSISDHLPIFTISKCISKRKKTKIEFKTIRNINDTNFKHFIDELSTTDWAEMYQILDVNLAYNYFSEKIKYALDKHCPVQVKK